MGRHDQLFKDLLEAFFGDFLALLAPRLVRKLRPAEARFLPKEYFTARPEGERRELDLVAGVPMLETRQKKKPLLIHVEVEARARRGPVRPLREQRLWEYAMLLRLQHRAPVLSVVVYLAGGPAGVQEHVTRERLPGRELAAFHHLSFGLAGCDAADYLARPEPLAWALAALMQPPGGRRSRLKLECLRRIQDADLDEARRFLLVNCVETYLQLEGEKAAEYTALVAADTNREVAAMEMTWADKLEHKGWERGRQAGREEGHREGRQAGMRAVVLDLLEARFGPISGAVRRRLEAIDSADELSRLAHQVVTAGSLAELGLSTR